MKKKLASYTRLRDEAGEQGAAARQLDDYLQVLLEAQRTQAKPALKAALSAFHRVAPLAAADPFLLSLLCVAVPLPSAAVAKKVLTNACTIATPDASVATVQCLLRRVGGDGDMCGACTELLLGLIERGLGGTAADVKKGLRLLKAVEDATPCDGLADFVCGAGLELVRREVTDAETLALFCDCVEVLGDDCGKRVCDALVGTAQAGSEQVTLQCLRLLLRVTRDHAARILHCPYALLNLVLVACARHNHVPALHVAALQLYAAVLPFVGLEEGKASDDAVNNVTNTANDEEATNTATNTEAAAKAAYLTYTHRAGSGAASRVEFDHYELPFAPLQPLRP